MSSSQESNVHLIEQEFDLDLIFTLNYSFDKLKQILAYLLASNKAQNNKIKQLEGRVDTHNDTLVDQNTTITNHNQDISQLKSESPEQDMKKLKEKVTKLEIKTNMHDNEIIQAQNNIDRTRRQIERALTSVSDWDDNDQGDIEGPDHFDKTKDSFVMRNKNKSNQVSKSNLGDEQNRKDDDITDISSRQVRENLGDRTALSKIRGLAAGDASQQTLSQKGGKKGGDFKNRIKDSRIQQIEKKIKGLEELFNSSANDIPTELDGAELQKIIAKLKMEQYEKFVDKEKMEEVMNRLKRNQEKTRKNDFEVDQLKDKFKDFERALDEERSLKADKAALDELSNMIDSLINNSGSKGPDISKVLKDQQKLRDIEQKLEKLQITNQNITSDYKSQCRGLRQRIEKLQTQMPTKANQQDLLKLDSQMRDVWSDIKFIKNDITEIQRRLNDLEANFRNLLQRLDHLDQRLGGVVKKIADLSSRQSVVKTNAPVIQQNTGNTGELAQKLQALRNELSNLKRDIGKQLKDLEIKVDSKADQEALVDLQNRLLQKLDAIISTLNKKFADKGETKKAIRALDKQLRHILENMSQHPSDGDDAMFARKPLGGWSCASCEKGLINLYGLMAEYYPWNRFPLRDPQDRIARVGQGFSKMLSKLDPQHMHKQQHQSPSRAMSPELLEHGGGGQHTHFHTIDNQPGMDRNMSKSTPYLPNLHGTQSIPLDDTNMMGNTSQNPGIVRNQSLPKIPNLPKQ